MAFLLVALVCLPVETELLGVEQIHQLVKHRDCHDLAGDVANRGIAIIVCTHPVTFTLATSCTQSSNLTAHAHT